MAPAPKMSRASCRCGEVTIEISGPPILSVTCCCESCRAAGLDFAQTSGAAAVVGPDGGTDYCLYRKDRLRVVAGGPRLQERRLTPASPTRRVLASCCATPMFLDFTRGHWISVYRGRIPEAPAPEMRVMAKAAPAGADLSGGTPTYAAFPGRFIGKLLAARMRMGFRPATFGW